MKARQVFLAAVVVVTLACVASAALTMIAPTGTYTNTRTVGMTPDGKYVVGWSYVNGPTPPNNWGPYAAGYNRGEQAIVYDAVNGSRNIVDTGVTPNVMNAATGVGYRTTSTGGQELVVSVRVGTGSNPTAEFADFHGTDTGGATLNGSSTVRTGLGPPNLYNAVKVGTDNIVRSFGPNGTSSSTQGNGFWKGTLTGDYPATLANTSFVNTVVNPTPPFVPPTANQKLNAYGISPSGRLVGGIRSVYGDSTYHKFYTDDGVTITEIPGMMDDGFGGHTNAGEAMAVSGNNRYIFGRSGAAGAIWPDRYDTVTGSIVNLPRIPGTITTSSVLSATNDGSMAVGMNFLQGDDERAVLYRNLLDPNPANWEAVDLMTLVGAGNLQGFVRLTRAINISDDGLTLSGEGYWSPDGGTTKFGRGWVLTIPEPASLVLFAIAGGLVMRRRHA